MDEAGARRWLGRAARGVALALPWCALLVHFVVLSRHLVDFPIADDWRALEQLEDPTALEWDWLWAPASGTLYAVGKLVDAVALGWLGYDLRLYQQLTFVAVFSALLLLSLRLLRRAAGAQAAPALFVLMVFAFQQPSYWGWITIGWHQPAAFVLTWLCLDLLTGGPAPAAARAPGAARLAALAVAAVACGLIYVSGALALCAASLWVAFCWVRCRSVRTWLPGRTVAGFAALCAALLALQWAAGGVGDPVAAAAARPWEPRFWGFLVGVAGKALGDARGTGPWAAVFGGLALVLLFALPLLRLARVARRAAAAPLDAHDRARLVVAGAILLGLVAYLGAVAFARAGIDGRPGAFLAALAAGKRRFHFVPLTFGLPWAVAALAWRPAAGETAPARGRRRAGWATAAALLGALALGQIGSRFLGFRFERFYVPIEDLKETASLCLRARLRQGRPLVCPVGRDFELDGAVGRAIAADLPLTRHLTNEVGELEWRFDGAVPAGITIAGGELVPRGAALVARGPAELALDLETGLDGEDCRLVVSLDPVGAEVGLRLLTRGAGGAGRAGFEPARTRAAAGTLFLTRPVPDVRVLRLVVTTPAPELVLERLSVYYECSAREALGSPSRPGES